MSEPVNPRLSAKSDQEAETASFSLAHKTFIITVVSTILYIGSIALFVL
jgi:hypothetical protein